MSPLRWVAIVATIIIFKGCQASPETQGPVFVVEPRSLVEFSNEIGTTIICAAQGSPSPAIIWLSDDGTPATSILHIREFPPNGSLHFPPFGAESYRHDVHAAVYRCEASNVVGKVISRDVTVRAVVHQHYDVIARDSYVLNGNIASLRCETPPNVRDMITVTSWMKDMALNIYPAPTSDTRHHMLPTGELLLYDVNKMDNLSVFRCRTVHRVTGTRSESVTHGRVYITEDIAKVPPRTVERPPPGPIREGETAVLTCISQGSPPPTYFWYRENLPLLSNDRIHIREAVLIINNVQVSDSGRFVCVANNSLGTEMMEYQLLVLQPLSVHLIPQQVRVDIGGTTELQCIVNGHPPAQVFWIKDGKPVRDSSHRIHVKGPHNSQLVISKVTRDDHGMYQCFAKNNYDMVQGTTQLRLGDSAPTVLYRFIEQTMQPGPSVSLKCIATGNPTPRFYWLVDGFPLGHSDRLMLGQYVTLNGDVVSHVNISRVHVADGGEYRCVAKNRVGEIFHSARLNIYGVPMVRPMSSIAAVAGRDLTVQCPVSGYPIGSIIWEKDGQLLPINRQQLVTENGTMIIQSVDKHSDRGAYTCTVRSKQGHQDSKTVVIDVKVPPKIEQFSFPTDIHEGSRVLVTCVLRSGDLPVRLEWLYNGESTLPAGVATYAHGDDDMSLRITNVAPHHAGNYTCVAKNGAATNQHTASLFVHVPPRIAPFSFNKHLSEGVRAHVSCVIEKGDPPFKIKWLKDGEPLEAEGLKIVGLDTHSSTVVVEALEARHSGNYTCQVKNQVASADYTAELIVSVPPRWSILPRDQHAPLGGENFQVDCLADGNPSPTMSWKRSFGKHPGEYQDIPQQEHGSGVRHFSNGTLIFDRLEESHEGYYLCEAFNGIGTMLSKRIFLVVNAPANFPSKWANQTARLGSTASLRCEAKGDQPLLITWRKNGVQLNSPSFDFRIHIKDANTSDGVMSEMEIRSTIRDDGGRYSCIASNAFGRDETNVDFYLQEPPDPPKNLHILEKGSRFVKLGWILSQDGNSPITLCIVEYKKQSVAWSEHPSQQISNGPTTSLTVSSLRPAVSYHFRVFVENDLGRSSASEKVEVVTDGEVPSDEPRNLRATPETSTTMLVQWDPPDREHWNGDILGYHIGYKEGRAKSEQYTFKTVEHRIDGLENGGEIVLQNLKKFTRYDVVVQAYNALGPGPMTPPISAITLEDVPSAPPQDIRCTAPNSYSLQINWSPVPESQLHGSLKGYKVMWESSDEDGEEQGPLETKVTSSHNTLLLGLNKYTNYSVQALATTAAGDGVPSQVLHCVTRQDVPEVPISIKAVISSPSSIIVSWLPPRRSNGILLGYIVHVRSIGGPPNLEMKPRRHSVAASNTHYVEDGLHKKGQYEFQVSAATKAGEGPKTPPVTLSPSSEVRASTYSFGAVVVVPWKSDAELPCLSVGRPDPSIQWRLWNHPLEPSARMQVQRNGALVLRNIIRNDTGNYSCHVENLYGSDSVTHRLVVQVPPFAPLLHVTSTTSSSLHVQWKAGDDGGSRIKGYFFHYRREQEDWETVQIDRHQTTYFLNNLLCGTKYQIMLEPFNAIGRGDKSSVVTASTDGGRPTSVAPESFVLPNSTFATLNLENWLDNGCPITFFEVEYRTRAERDWILASNSVDRTAHYVLRNLNPGSEYFLRVRANNHAGSTATEYQFCTLRYLAGTSPSLTRLAGPVFIPFYMDLRVILPLLASCLVILCGFLALYYCFQKRGGTVDGGSLHDSQSSAHMGSSQMYPTLRKASRDDMDRLAGKGYADDIYPYATFELSTNPCSMGDSRCVSGAPQPGVPSLQTFLYDGAETMPLRDMDPKKPGPDRRRPSDSEELEYDSMVSEDEGGDHPHTPGHRMMGDMPGLRSHRGHQDRQQTFDHRSGSHLSRRSRYNNEDFCMSIAQTPDFKQKSLSRRERIRVEAADSYPNGTVIYPPSEFGDEAERSSFNIDVPPKPLNPIKSQFKIPRDFTITV